MSHEATEVEVNIENASKHGLSFNNSPTANRFDMTFTGVNWGSGTLSVDAWAKVLAQDVLQDGNKYSVRSRYDGNSYEALWDLAFLHNDEIVLEIDNIRDIYDDFLPYGETTGNKLTGDQILQLLLTGNDSKIFEVIFIGNDKFNLSNGNDVVYGYGGDDTINAKGGDDIINGGPGDDTIYGDDGNDTIDGGAGRDTIYGGEGNDMLKGGGGYDGIYGGSGNDTINAAFYRSFIKGEDGNDRVVYLTTTGGTFDGGNGEDSATFSRDSKNYAISAWPGDDNGFIQVLSFGGSAARLWSTELLEFRDGTISIDDFMYTGDYTPVASTSIDPIFRFYNTRDKAFFYTSSSAERDYVILNSAPKYTSGTGGYLDETAPYHRYFSYYSWTSWHFLEREDDLDNDANNYVYEGIFNLPIKADDDPFKGLLDDDDPIFIPDSLGSDTSWPYVYQGGTFEAAHTYLNSDKLAPVHRFYNYETGHHFFTVAEAEADMIKGKIASGEWPFNYEGTRFSVYSADPTTGYQGQEIAVHRFYSPTLNRHFFTADTEEVNLIKLTGVWNDEGIAFWGEILG